tara:strand:+ start:588 stop:1928 length:1341 start_codon:yes stop_codon:yes gene_type:complete
MNVAKIISDNTCVHCGNIVNENLRKWFKDKWVNIGKKKKGGGHPPCGTSGKKRGYAKCVPKSKAANMTKKQKASATRRKRAAQNKAGRGGTSSTRGGGKKPINVKTKAESKMNLESYVGKMMTEAQFDEAAGKKDACYHKVKARYDVWPSAYASGALVKCRKVGAKNWGNKSKKEGVNERTKMKPQVKKLLKQKGYSPIFGAIDNSKRQLKQMRYSRGEIRDTLISMFGDEDPKILQRIKESINEKKGDFLDSLFPKSKVDKAVKIAHDMGGDMTGAVKKIERYFKGMTLHSKVRDALQQANESVNENNMGDELWEACWKGYEKKGMKKMFGKMYPNCVKKESYDIFSEDGGWGYTMDGIVEAEYQGRKVKLGKPMQGDVKKFKVYVKNPKGNVVKVNFGQGGDAKGGTMKIRKSNPGARKSFRARHNCDSPGPRHKARYWSCRKW